MRRISYFLPERADSQQFLHGDIRRLVLFARHRPIVDAADAKQHLA